MPPRAKGSSAAAAPAALPAPAAETALVPHTEAWKYFTPPEIDPSKCWARIWFFGRGGQCSRDKGKSSDYCGQHAKGEKWKVHGRIDGPIPCKKIKEFIKEREYEEKHGHPRCQPAPSSRRETILALEGPPAARGKSPAPARGRKRASKAPPAPPPQPLEDAPRTSAPSKPPRGASQKSSPAPKAKPAKRGREPVAEDEEEEEEPEEEVEEEAILRRPAAAAAAASAAVADAETSRAREKKSRRIEEAPAAAVSQQPQSSRGSRSREQERHCPSGHRLTRIKAYEQNGQLGTCDLCAKPIPGGDFVFECETCSWWLCTNQDCLRAEAERQLDPGDD